MKSITLILASFCILTSLFSQTSSVKNPYPPAERDGILKILTGEWISQTYHNELVKTKSPYRAYKNSKEWRYLAIKQATHDANMITVTMKENFSTESSFANFNMVKTDSLKFMLGSGDKVSILKILSPLTDNSYRIFYSDGFNKREDRFIKCASAAEVVNSECVAGTYTYDADTGMKTVVFSKNGSITGLEDFKTYKIQLDYSSDSYDCINLYGGVKNLAGVFEIDGNILKLYNLGEDYDEEYDQYYYYKGDLKYKLTKAK